MSNEQGRVRAARRIGPRGSARAIGVVGEAASRSREGEDEGGEESPPRPPRS